MVYLFNFRLFSKQSYPTKPKVINKDDQRAYTSDEAVL